jgi:hypothetical protein
VSPSSSVAAWLVTLLAILGVTALTIGFNGGTSVGSNNHVGQLPVVRRVLDPTHLPGDFTIEIRLHHHRVFTYLIAAGSLLFGEDPALILLNLVGKGLLVTALWRLCRAMKIPLAGFVAAGVALAAGLALTGRGLEENGLAGDPEIMPPTFAHAFVLWSVASLLEGRHRLAAFWAGLATSLHIQIGLIFAAAVVPLYVVRFATLGPMELSRLVAVFVLAASPGLFSLVQSVGRGIVPLGAGAPSLAHYNDFRHPQHFALISKAVAAGVAGHIVVQVLSWWWLRRTGRPGAGRVGVLLALSLTLGAFALVHFTDYYVLRDGRIASIQFIRLSPLITLFGTLSAIAVVTGWASDWPRRRPWTVLLVNASLVLITASWAADRVRDGASFSLGVERYVDEATPWVDICLWIRDHGPRALYLTPPGDAGFTVLSRRSNVVEFKNNPNGASFLPEWFARLRDLSGGTLPAARGWNNAPLLNRAYAALDSDRLAAVGRKYGAAYAVVPTASPADLHVLYRNADYRLVKLPEAPDEPRAR